LRFPAFWACEQIAFLGALTAEDIALYREQYELGTRPVDLPERDALFDQYWILRSRGFTADQIVQLAEAAHQDAAEPTPLDTNRSAVFAKLYREERRDIDALIAGGTLAEELRQVTEAVTRHILDHGYATQLRRDHQVNVTGPIGAFIDEAASERAGSLLASGRFSTGCYSPQDGTTTLFLNRWTLDHGRLSLIDRHSAVHETVHATTMNYARARLDDSGKLVTKKMRSGLTSRAAKPARASRGYVLTGLNEGITELLARNIGSSEHLSTDYGASGYDGFISDTYTLCRELRIDFDALFALYYNPRGIMELNRLMVERLNLGPHALTIFEIMNRSQDAGFSRFIAARRLYATNKWVDVEDMVLVHRSWLVVTASDGAMRPRYPWLPPEELERLFPYVRVVS
jgi:hypothetical protein